MIKNIIKLVRSILGYELSGNKNFSKKRKLVIESLETRELLSVSVADFDLLRSCYSDINFESSLSQYNVIELTASQLDETNLKNAIATAGTTTQNDLIVLRGGKESIIDLGNSYLNINIDSNIYGSVGIFSLGEGLLQIENKNNSQVINIVNGEVLIGGVAVCGYETANATLSATNLIQTNTNANLITDSVIKAVKSNGNAGNYSLYAAENIETTASADIGSRTRIKADIQLAGTEYAFLAGLSETEYNSFLSGSNDLNIVKPYDAEKYMTNIDSNLCWAASAANMLAYTNWGDVNGFQNEDDIFDYFRDNFTNEGSNQFLGFEWFFTGEYGTGFNTNVPDLAQVTNPNSGGLYFDEISWQNYALLSNGQVISEYPDDFKVSDMQNIKNKFDENFAIGLGIALRNGGGGHAITMWGFVYDTSKTGNDYYVSLLISDSDNNPDPNNPYGAPDTLDRLNIQYNATLDTYLITGGSVYPSNDYILTSYYFLDQRLTTPDTETPSAPQNLTVTEETINSISLSWDSQEGLTGYKLEYKKTADTDWVVWTPAPGATATAATVTGLEADTNYEFRLTAINNNDESEPATTNGKTLAVADDDTYEDNDSISIVDGVALDSEADHTSFLGVIETEKTINGLKLVDGNDFYKFEITQTGTAESYVQIAFENSQGDIDLQLYNANGTSIRLSTTTANSEKISLNGLAAGIYYAQVYSYRGSSNSNYTLKIVPPNTAQNANTPNAPEGLTATQTANGQVTITWNNAQNEQSYNIYLQNNSVWNLIGSTTNNSYAINELTDGTYNFAVAAAINTNESNKITVNVNVVNETIITGPAEDNYENNNTIETAYNLGAITQLITIENLALLDEADFYKIELTTKGDKIGYVRIDFDHSLGDLELQLFNSSKKSVKSVATTGNAEQFNLNGLAAGTYYIKVYGYRQSTNPSYSLTINPPAASVVTPQPPAAPSGLTATKNENTVTLNWNAVTGATSYNVYRQDGQNWSLIGSANGTSYSVSDLTDGTYNFAVAAVSNNGVSEKTTTSITLVSPPLSPSGLTATKNENTVTLNWNAATGATSYNIYRQDGQNWSLIGSANGTSYSISDLTDGTYNFAVAAVSNNGVSEKTTTSITLVSPPATPSNLSANQTANGQVTITWNAVNDANAYNVYRQVGQNLTLVGTVTSTSCTFNDLDDGLHSFAVSAVSNNGESGKNIVTINVVNEVIIIVPTEDAYENNNTIETAYNLGAITALTKIEGLALLDEADFYKIELTTKGDKIGYVRIDFDHSIGDLELQLFNSSKKSVKSVATTGNAEQFNLNGLAAGTYYIKVYGYRQATNPSYTLTINPPAASITSSPVTLSAASTLQTDLVPALTGNYQIYSGDSAIALSTPSQQNNNFAYADLSNQFFATPPTEFLANAPVIEIVGHEVGDDGKISLQYTVKNNNNDESNPPVQSSEFITATNEEFQINATFSYFSNGKTMTGVVKSNVYSLLNLSLLQN
ncbi:MAG: fibronectin type III domain-containing protein [Planctomycetaceae bacterium]|jgi:hypothetical protein|nr:fibronectin type III domain-containing protein [Planctomycetaceae bacterium]